MIATDDVCVWPDGTSCRGEDLSGYQSFMSDDFRVLRFETPEWVAHEAEEWRSLPLADRLMMRARVSPISMAACALLDEVAAVLGRCASA